MNAMLSALVYAKTKVPNGCFLFWWKERLEWTYFALQKKLYNAIMIEI